MNTTALIGQPALDIQQPAPGDYPPFFSVTTIIGVLDKSALKYWSAELTAEAAIDNEQTWKAMLADRGRPEAVTWLRDAMNRIPRNKLKADDLGTVTHKTCEEYAITGTRPTTQWVEQQVRAYGNATTDIEGETTVIEQMVDQFEAWCQDFSPAYEAAEMTVYDPRYGYAGQADAVAVIGGVRFLMDYKTSRQSYDRRGEPRRPYPEQVGLQLAAYRYAECAAPLRTRPRRYTKSFRRYYLLNETEYANAVPVPEVDHGLVIQLTPEHCHAYPINADREAHTAFLHCLEAFRWVEITSKQTMGDPLTC